jgi:PAS domain S-box-containing protein
LIYNEAEHVLEGKVPFQGVPPQFVEVYRITVLPNLTAEKMLVEQRVILSENASEDPFWDDLGMQHLAQAASIHDAILQPLVVGGRSLGYLQAANHHDGSSIFTLEEKQLLLIAADQSAAMIDNATLSQQTRTRAQRFEMLRRVSNLVSTYTSPDDLVRMVLSELNHHLRLDIVAAFILDPKSYRLELHQPSFITVYNLTERSKSLLVDDAQFLFTVTGSQRSFLSNHASEDSALLPFYRQLVSEWKAESALVVPLVAGDENIGEVWLASMRPDHFDQNDLQIASIVGSEIASVIRQNRLVTQTDASLRERTEQLITISQVDREMVTIMELEPLLETIYDQALQLSGADCGQFNFFGEQPNPALGASQPALITRGESYSGQLSALEFTAFENQKTINVAEVRNADGFTAHGEIQSALILPLVSQQRTLAMLVLHSKTKDYFTSKVDILEIFLAHAAISLENTLRYDALGRRLNFCNEELDVKEKLIQIGQALRPNRPLQEALNDVCSIIQTATSFHAVYVLVYDAATKQVRRLSQGGAVVEGIQAFVERPQPWQTIQTLLRTEYKHGRSYWIPRTFLTNPISEMPGQLLEDIPLPDNTTNISPDDILLLPLYTADKTPLGVILMGEPQDGRIPGWPTVRALDLFSIQVSMIIDSNRYITALASSLSDVEVGYSRLLQASATSSQRISMMLHKDLEQVLINRNLSEDLERSKLLPEIIEATNQQQDMYLLVRNIAEVIILHFNFQVGLVAFRNRSQMNITDVIGVLPANMNPETWMGQQNPMRQALTDGEMLLVNQVQEEGAIWASSSMIRSLDAKSFLALPFTIDLEHTAAILLLSNQPSYALTDEDQQLFVKIQNLISAQLQRLYLLNETVKRLNEVNLLLDFTQNLNLAGSSRDENESGRSVPQRILNLLLDTINQVVPGVQAGWIGMWDEQERCITPVVVTGFSDANSLMKIKFKDAKDPDENLLPLQVYHAGMPFRIGEIQFAKDYHLPSDDLMLYHQATNQHIPESSMLVPFHQGEMISGVVVLDNYEVEAAFSEQDELVALSLINQTALVLENARLFSEGEERNEQLKNLTRASSVIGTSLNTNELFDLVLGQLKTICDYDTATLWMREGGVLKVVATNGFADKQNRLGLKAALEDSVLFQEMMQSGDAIMVSDIRSDVRFPSLLEPDYLSWLGIPLREKSTLLGMIALEKKEAGSYNLVQVQLLKTFIGQAVAALENARLYEESENRLVELNLRTQRLSILDQLSSELGTLLDVDSILLATSKQLLTALKATAVGVVIAEDDAYVLKMDIPDKQLLPLPYTLPAERLFNTLKESKGIFITDTLPNEVELAPLYDVYFKLHGSNTVLIIPLVTTERVFGWMLAQSNVSYRFNMQEIELARTIGNQVAVAIQKATLLEETRRLSADLERRVNERTAELQIEHQYTEALLHITTQLSSSLELDDIVSNTLNILNTSLGAEQSLILLSDGTSRHYDAGMPIISLAKAAENPVAFQPDQAIINLFLHTDEPILASDVIKDNRFEIPGKEELGIRSVVSMPLILADQTIGSLLLVSRQIDAFNEEDVRLCLGAARQISIAMNKADLYEISMEQSNRLIEMLRSEEIASSRSLAILEAVADGVLVTDSDNIITLFNNSAEHILDLRASEALGKTLDEFFNFFGNVAERWTQTIQRWSLSPTTYQTGNSYSEQLNLKNNRVVLVSLAPVIMGETFLGTVSIFRDITHQVQVDRLKSEFVANVSHELRTPMTSIKGYVDILLMGAAGEITSKQAQFLQVVKSNAERLGILVNDLLDVSKIEAGQAVLSFEEISLVKFADELIAEAKERSDQNDKHFVIENDYSADIPTVRGDPNRIHQVLSNLLMNAYNYTPVYGQIRLKISVVENMVQVDVSDNGIGIAHKDQHRIFERFYRGEDPLVLATAGTGLGLAISRILVEMHGGKIWFTSAGVAGKGSTFSFTLPIYRSEE